MLSPPPQQKSRVYHLPRRVGARVGKDIRYRPLFRYGSPIQDGYPGAYLLMTLIGG